MGAAKRRAAAAATGCPYHASIAALPTPARIQALSTDRRGFPVPWFVYTTAAGPDHRIVDQSKIPIAVANRLCWICGQPLGKTFTFAIGPMCAVNRVSSEPPSHDECARYAVQACPFLSRPEAHRRRAGLPEDELLIAAAGIMLDRNPGVTLLWATRDYRPKLVGNGVLFTIGDPVSVEWMTHGRPATRAEAASALYRGLPTLIGIAHEDGPGAEAALAAQIARVPELLPAEAP